jgi:hypothetical protein
MKLVEENAHKANCETQSSQCKFHQLMGTESVYCFRNKEVQAKFHF